MSKVKTIINFFIILGLILPNFTFAQNKNLAYGENLDSRFAQIQQIETLKTKGGAIAFLKEVGNVFLEKIPETFGRIWKEGILPIWNCLFEWFKLNIWPKIKNLFQREAETKKPIIKEEFQKERVELKEEAPTVLKTLWEKFKELIK